MTSGFESIHKTQQLANAAETFVKVLASRFPGNTFEQLYHGSSLQRAYWKALQRTLKQYVTRDNLAWANALMNGDVLAEPRVAAELIKVFIPEEVPDYSVVAEVWSTALGAGLQARALLGRETELLFTLLADELRESPDIRVVLHQLAQGRARALSGLFDKLSTQEADLVRLLDAALVSGPSTLGLQVRHLLALSKERPPSDRPVSPTRALESLIMLAGHLSPGALSALWQRVEAVQPPELRWPLVGQIAPHLARAGLVDDALTLVTTHLDSSTPSPDPASVAELLLNLAPHLSVVRDESALSPFQERLFELVRAINDPASQLRALTALLQALPAPLQSRAAGMAIDIATTSIPGEITRADALCALCAFAPPDGIDRLAALAREMQSPEARALLLGRLLPYLPLEDRPQALLDTLTTIGQINGDEARTQALIARDPHIEALGPLGQIPEAVHNALSTTFSITRPDDRAQAFAALAPYLSPELLAEALHLVKGITDEHERARTLIQLAPHLPADLLVSAFVAAQEFTLPDRRAAALAAIAPYLQPPARQQALGLALAAALAVQERYARVEVLVDLAPHLPDELKERAMQDALTATRSIPDEAERARALVFLAPHMLPHQYADAVADAYTIINPLELVSALSALMPYLPPDPWMRVGLDMIRRAHALGDMQHKAGILASVAPVLPDNLVHEAAQVAMLIDTPYEQIHVLTALLPRDPDLLREAALAAARAIPSPYERVGALLELIPYLPVALRQAILDEALDAAVQIADDYDRASALAGFGPYASETHALRDRQHDALSLALDACLEVPDPMRRTALLTRLARTWTSLLHPDQAYVMWRRVVLFLRDQPQDEVIAGLAALAPVIAALGAQGPLDDIAGVLVARVLGSDAPPSPSSQNNR